MVAAAATSQVLSCDALDIAPAVVPLPADPAWLRPQVETEHFDVGDPSASERADQPVDDDLVPQCADGQAERKQQRVCDERSQTTS